MLSEAELEARIQAMADAHYGPGTIIEVHCKRDEDHVGDPVVWVRFVAKDGAMPFDPEGQVSFSLALRLAFDDWGDPAYPVSFFNPVSEYRKLFPAAA
ncbi:hypothetical protein [Antarcticirhabdus aurantiaca]|uniref:Uncharacterized protein n=1 Tax=Antarcticirhabdus aurantiaca TaxID=2606717 RepID=A0ACD4NSQ8_9HYPH|nr:hypothetical protein [Antarcticirhabdus aurantiaca]WAJ29871.1 hypothetical protein OXU80_06530 [Jeongeuplla avenae]